MSKMAYKVSVLLFRLLVHVLARLPLLRTTTKLYQVGAPKPEAKLDVVVVHGLGGDAWGTWARSRGLGDVCRAIRGREGEIYWPYWLSCDEPSVSVYAIDYPTYRFRNRHSDGDSWAQMRQRAAQFRACLKKHGIGKRPFVIVAHSLGGILVKTALVDEKSHRSEQETLRSDQETLRLCKEFIFVATPHMGSALANIAVAIPGLRWLDVALLKENNRAWNQLDMLHRAFLREIANARDKGARPAVIGFFESLETNGVLVVNRHSAMHQMDNNGDALLGSGLSEGAVEGTHTSCCKPVSREDRFYVNIQERIRGALEDVSDKSASEASGLTKSPGVSEADRLHMKWRLIRGVWDRLALVAATVVFLVWFGPETLRWYDSDRERSETRELVELSMQRWLTSSKTDGLESALHSGDGRAASLGDVLVAANPDLALIDECVRAHQGRCSSITFITAPGGFGKGPIARRLAKSGAALIDLADGLDNEACRDERCRHRCGLPESQRVPGEAAFGCVSYASVGGLELQLPRLDSLPSFPTDREVVVIDSFDEVDSETRRHVLDAARASLADPGAVLRMVVVMSRAEAVRDVGYAPLSSDREYQVVRVMPLYVGSAARWKWYLADVACYAATIPSDPDRLEEEDFFDPRMRPSEADCADFGSRMAWADRVVDLGASLSREQRYFAFAGATGNALAAHLLAGRDDGWAQAVMVSLVERAARHGRPQSAGDAGGKFGAYVDEVVGAVNEIYDSESGSGSNNVFRVMSYSSFADVRPAPRARRWEVGLSIPSLRSLILCTELDGMNVESVDRCVEGRLRRFPWPMQMALDLIRGVIVRVREFLVTSEEQEF